jgi:bifunctional non-homologous end joining protein LigD
VPRQKNNTQAPAFIEPMAAVVVDALPEGPEWFYELKFDGYRALLIKDEEMVWLHSRKDKDLTAMYPGIIAAGERLDADLLVLDGEIVALAG